MTRPPGRWETLPAEATILVVVHTVASLMRVLDYVELLEDDPRIRLEWTVAPDRFNVGVTAGLAHLGIETVPWAEATERSYDLAIATSLHRVEDIDAKHRFAAPHGCGYGKKYPGWSWPTDEEPPVYGLDRESLVDSAGEPVFSKVVVPHVKDLEILNRQCPEAAHTGLVAGDLTFDKLLAAKAFRERYRLDLGVRRRQTLVAVGSTWGGESLLRHFPDLPVRLMRELPADHRVVMTMHPAAWFEHGPRHVRAWLREATEAGLDLIDPGADWRPLLAAADFFVGDHTSLTPYAAASGLPVLLSHFTRDEVAPSSTVAELAEVGPVLTDEPLPAQLAKAAVAGPDQQRIALGRISSQLGRSALVVREAVYALVGLPEPAAPPRIEPTC
jgi:hypothetical protein